MVMRNSPAGRHGCAGEFSREGRDILLHALGEGRHLLPRRRQRIAGPAPLEELDAEFLLELAEAAEHRRMVDAQPLRGAGEAARLGDCLDEPEIVPGQMLEGGHLLASTQR